MKKIVCGLLGSLFLSTAPVYGDWHLLARQAGVQGTEILFTDFLAPEYNDYIFIIDMLEPLGGFSDTLLQVSTDGGATWRNADTGGTYTGGSTCVKPRGAEMIPVSATSNGIPMTNVDNEGYYYIGEMRISGLNGASEMPTVKGFGQMGNETFGTTFGTLGIISGVNAVRFISADTFQHPKINRYDITLYGLN